VAFQRRTRKGGATIQSGPPLAAAPYWVKLKRNGQTITASASSDGRVWTVLGSSTIHMTGEVYVGLAVTSHTTAATATATFTDVVAP
jgi:regulation of enolase protein 1 (concanavalin A-like superfamily)